MYRKFAAHRDYWVNTVHYVCQATCFFRAYDLNVPMPGIDETDHRYAIYSIDYRHIVSGTEII